MIKYVCYAIIKTQGDRIRMFNAQGSKIAVGVNKFKEKCTREMFASYGITTAVTLLIMILVKGSYALTSFRYYPFMLSNASVCYAVLASVLMQGYIRNTRQFSINNRVLRCLMAVSYGLSGFFVTQENTWSTCVIGVALPVLVLLLEDVIDGVRYIPFVVLGAILLSVDSLIAVPAMLLLFLYAIADKAGKDHFTLGDFITYLATFLFSALLGSWRIVFQYIVRWMEHGDYAYPGFKSFYGGSAFLSRILPGSASAYTFLGTNQKMDAYVSLLVVMGIMLFVFHSQISLRKRIAYAINLVISAILVVTTAGYYVLHLFTYDDTVTLGYSVVLVFLMIRMAMEALAQVDNIRRATWIKAVVGTLLVFAGAWSFSAHNFHAYAGTLQILGMIILVVGLAGSRKNRKLFGAVLFVCCAVEITGQSWISVNGNYGLETAKNVQVFNKDYGKLFAGNFFKQTKDVNKKTEETKTEAKNDKKASSNAEKYSNFLEKYRDTKVEDNITQLYSMVSMTNKELKKATGTPFPDFFETTNAYANKLGVSTPLFHKEKLTIKFTGENADRITDLGNQIYAIDYVDGKDYPDGSLITYEVSTEKEIYVLSDADNMLVKMNGKKGKTTGYLYFSTINPLVYNIDFLSYSLDKSAYHTLLQNMKAESKAQKKTSYLLYDYIGMGFSYVGLIMIVLFCFYDKRAVLINTIKRVPTWIEHRKWICNFGRWIKAHRVYLAAFFIPFAVWMVTLLVTNCAPFGNNSIFNSDGMTLTIPTVTDNWFQNRYTGNKYLSMNLGYGFNLGIYYTYYLLGKFYALLPYSAIIGTLSVQVALSMGCIGWSMSYYMFHRKMHQPAKPNDWFVLAPVFVYTLCSYMLAMRIYPTWLLIYALFPIIVAKMDDLMIEKRWFGYTLLLGICIFLEIQLALFVCIYLLIRFFTYHFDGIKDFLVKGIRFGSMSILAAGCGFFSIARTIQEYQNSAYQANDSVFQGFGLYNNFIKQWTDFLMFSNTHAVNEDDGALLGYMGMITLILVLSYVFYKEERIIDKIKRVFPLIFLVISFNGKALSFVWNGFHYQSLVPNRYIFLLIFLCGEIIYDCKALKVRLGRTKNAMIVLGLFVLAVLMQGFEKEFISTSGLVGSISVMVVLTVGVMLYNEKRNSLSLLIMGLLMVELFANYCYAVKEYNVEDLAVGYGDVNNAQKEYALLENSNGVDRSINIVNQNEIRNYGQYFNLSNTGAFNSYINNYQMNTNQMFGFGHGRNFISSNYSSSVVGCSLANIRYILCPVLSMDTMNSMVKYKYIGKSNAYYIFENDLACSLGYYVPLKFQGNRLEVKNNVTSLESIFMPDTGELYQGQTIQLNQEYNSFHYTDINGNIISQEEAVKKANSNEIIKMKIDFKAQSSGDAYIYLDQLIYLGRVSKGKRAEFVINSSKDTYRFMDKYNISIQNPKAEKKLLTEIKENNWENVSLKNDALEGTVDFDEDGSMMFALAYSKNWQAYVDGKKVKLYSFNDGNMLIKVDRGKHNIELRYVPYLYNYYQCISGIFFVIICLAKLFCAFIQYHKRTKRADKFLMKQ